MMKKLTPEQRDFIQRALWLGKEWRKTDWLEVSEILHDLTTLTEPEDEADIDDTPWRAYAGNL